MAGVSLTQVPQSTVITVSDGTTTTKALRDSAGRIITAQQIQLIRGGQQMELDKVATLRDQLIAGDASAVELILGQARDEFERRLAVMDLQRTDLQNSLQKLKEGETAMRREIVSKMIDRLRSRVDVMTASRDHSDELLAQMQTADAGDAAPAISPLPPVSSGGGAVPAQVAG